VIGRAQLRRRTLLATAAGAGLAAHGVAAQQRGRIPRLAIVVPGDKAGYLRQRHWTAFFAELRRLRYDEGQTLEVAWHSSEGQDRHATELARQIARARPGAVFTSDSRMAAALKTVAGAVPTVAITDDPVHRSLAASLARPGGNITGFAVVARSIVDLVAKRLVLLKEVVPGVSKVAFVVPRRVWDESIASQLREAAAQTGITVLEAVPESPADETEYRRVVAAALRQGADALYVTPAQENLVHRRLIARLAAEARLPTICIYRENVEAGGLMGYAVDLADIYRGAAGYIDRILGGASPAEMPFQQPTKFELVINLGTARALGRRLCSTAPTR
jgi:putative ABC transport system substrate-binding protein